MNRILQNKITIGITAYNEGKYLLDAWNSVVDQLDSRWQSIMVLDGNSDNGTEQIFDKINHKSLSKIKLDKNVGPYRSRTLAIENSTTDWYCQLDADDILDKNYVSQVLECINNNLNADIIYYDVRYLRENTISIKEYGNANYNQLPFLLNSHCPIYKNIFFELGGYSEKLLESAADRDFLIRCAIDNKKFVYLSGCTLYTVRKRNFSVGANRSKNINKKFMISRYFHKKYAKYFIDNNYYAQFYKDDINPILYSIFKKHHYIKFLMILIVLCYESRCHILNHIYSWYRNDKE